MNQSAPSFENYPQRSLRDFYYILFRHKWKVIIFFLAAMTTVTLGTFLVPEIYKSEARLLVRIGRESVSLDPTATTGQVISVGLSRESEINSELEILKSRELAQKVVDTIGPRAFLEKPDELKLGVNNARDTLRETRKTTRSLTRGITKFLEDWDVLTPLDDRERAVNTFQKSLEIESQKDSNILFLSYKAQGAELAQRILAKLIDFYFDKHITAHRTTGSYEFFDRQTDQLRSQLTKTEQKLKGLKDRTGVASLDEQRRIILTRIGNLQQEAETTQAALAISRGKVRELRNKLAGLSENLVTQETKGTQNYGADLMRARLYEMKLKEQELLSRYTESSVLVQEVRRQIAEAQALLANEKETRTQVTTGINPTHQQINLALLTETANLSSLEDKSRVLEQQLKAGQKEIQDLTAAEMRLVNLQRELAMQDGKYRKYSENLEQARIDQALETNKISNISVIEAATVSKKPIKPRKALNLALGFIVGILGGLVLAFFSEYLDHSIKTPQDIEEKVNLQILASIPYLKRSHKSHVTGHKAWDLRPETYMYNDFFSFAESPFNVTPDPRFLFLTDSHREALASMMYGICDRKGFVSIIGEVGTGKTTLIRHVLDSLRSKKVETVFLYQTIITFDQMLKEILLELDIPLGDESKTSMIRQLNEYLIQRLARNENLALIIDEAQNLDRQVLEDLHLLSNLETNSSKLLQILLVGQPELEAKLSSPELRQLKQRITIGRKIRPLNVEESRQYIEHRLRLVGSSISKVFKPEALSLICEYGRGIPRTINMLCDNAFLIGYGLAQKKIDATIIREAINDMGLSALEEPVPQEVILRRRSRVLRNYLRPGAAYSRAALLVFLVLILSLPFFFSKEFIKPTPSKLEAKTSATESVNVPFDKRGQEGISEAKPTSEASPKVKTEPISAVNPYPAAEPKPGSLEARQSLPVSTTPKIPPKSETRVKKIVTVESGDTIFSLSQKYYRRADIFLLDKILEFNPGITNPYLIPLQQKIKIPEITEASLVIPSPDGTCKVHLGTFSRPKYAKPYRHEPVLKGKSIEVIRRKISPGKTWYRVLAGKFSNTDECLRVIGILKEKGLLTIPEEKG